MEKSEKKEQVDEVITALYKVDLNCPQCIRAVRKPLLSTQGVHAVDVDAEKGELNVKGRIDPKEIHAQIEKLSKKKVVMVSPATKNKGDVANEKVEKETHTKSEKIVIKETKEPTLRVTTIKVHMHCESCAHELRKRLLKHKAIYSVKTDMKAETLTVEGPIEADKLVAYIKNKVHKHAEIIPPKQEKQDEKKEKVTIEIIKEKEKKEEIKEGLEEKVEIKEGLEEKVEIKEGLKEEIKEERKEGNVPYIIHYVYAPQLFSDENPNACFIL